MANERPNPTEVRKTDQQRDLNSDDCLEDNIELEELLSPNDTKKDDRLIL